MAGSGDRQVLTADDTTTFNKYRGPVCLSLSGTFGGGTAKLQRKDPSDAIVDVQGGSFTAVTDTIYDFPQGEINDLAVNLAGSTGPALVTVIQGKK